MSDWTTRETISAMRDSLKGVITMLDECQGMQIEMHMQISNDGNHDYHDGAVVDAAIAIFGDVIDTAMVNVSVAKHQLAALESAMEDVGFFAEEGK